MKVLRKGGIMNINPVGCQQFKGALVLSKCTKDGKPASSESIDTSEIDRIIVGPGETKIRAWVGHARDRHEYVVKYPSSEKVLEAYTAACQGSSRDLQVAV